MPGADAAPPPNAAIVAGWHALRRAPADARAAIVFLLLVLVLMLPFGRETMHRHRAEADPLLSGTSDAGGLLAPLTADSGFLIRHRPGTDFFSLYDAGARVLVGRDPFAMNIEGTAVRAPFVIGYRYPATAAFLVGVPLNLLPPWPAYTAWVMLSAAMLVANFLLCAGRAPRHIVLLGLIWLAWVPAVAEFHVGQYNILVGTLLLWTVDALLRGARGAALPWLVACQIKIFPIAWAPLLWLWGRRRGAIVGVLVLAVGTVGWAAVSRAGVASGLIERGLAGRAFAAPLHAPYAGAMGVQELVNCVVWKVQGRSLALDPALVVPPPASDPVFLTTAALSVAYALLCLWALWRSRHATSLPALGILWLAWYVVFRDVWEHHYLMIQPLLALLVVHGLMPPRRALAAWLLLGGPSLWLAWSGTGYAGTLLNESLGTLYFVQRPAGLAIVLVTLIAALRSSSTPPPGHSQLPSTG